MGFIDQNENFVITNNKKALYAAVKATRYTDEELEKMLNSDVDELKYICVWKKYKLDKLMEDKSLCVRCEVAEHGYGLDKLVYDESWQVRREVAEKGNHSHLMVLSNDKDYDVRKAVVKRGFALDKFKNDEDWRIRMEVALQGAYLDELVNDEDQRVSSTAARIRDERAYKATSEGGNGLISTGETEILRAAMTFKTGVTPISTRPKSSIASRTTEETSLQLAEAKRLEEEKAAAEAKRLEEEKAAEAKRLEEEAKKQVSSNELPAMPRFEATSTDRTSRRRGQAQSLNLNIDF